jgi:hypothetical protein
MHNKLCDLLLIAVMFGGFLIGAGCATSGPRVNLGYADRDHLFAVQLRDARAEAHGPSSGGHGLAARMGGNVCGTDIAYDAEYWGHYMAVTGFATNSHSQGDNLAIVITNTTSGLGAWTTGQGDSRPVTLQVRDEVQFGASARHVTGAIGQVSGMLSLTGLDGRMQGSHVVDIVFNRERLVGDVGLRRFDLRRVGDDLMGSFVMYGQTVPFVVRGADELWSMPAAAQAAILPLALSCTEERKVVQRLDFRNEI